MIKAKYPTLQVNDLAEVIRESIAPPETAQAEQHFNGQQPPSADSVTLKLQPDFVPKGPGGTYSLNDLLRFHDRVFLENAFRAILQRRPSAAEYAFHLSNMRSGHLNKIDVLAALRYSAEGKAQAVEIDGLRTRAWIRQVGRIPVVGYAVRLAIALIRLPNVIRDQRQFDQYLLSQNQDVADFINRMSDRTAADISKNSNEAQRLDSNIGDLDLRLLEMVAQHENLEAETMLQLRTLTRDVAVNKEQLETQKHEWSKRFEAQHQALQNEFETAIRIAIRQVKGELMGVMSESQSATQSAVKELAAELERLNQMLQLTRAEVTIRRAESAEFPSTTTTESITTDDNRLDSLYASLEDRFRGSPDEIKERFSLYLPFIRQACTADNPRVVDLGCGRGEWLELLQREKISAHGVDTNRIFLSRCRESGFDVTEEDVLTYLGTLETASISAVTGFHIIEHLPFDYLVRLLDEVMRVLRAGGLILFETPNPDNVLVGSNFFYFDPSHRHPLPSSLMELLLETRGFADIEIKNLHPWDSGRVEGRGELAERFNGLFYGPMDYAILGWKPQA